MSQNIHVEDQASVSAYIAGFFGLVGSFFGIPKIWNVCRRTWKYIYGSQDEIEAMRQVVEGKENEIATLQRALTDSLADITTKDGALMTLRKEMDRIRNRSVELEQQSERSREQTQVLDDKLKGQANEARMLRGELQQTKLKYTQTLELLESRTAELKGAQTFLTKTDVLSGADVIGMVEALNSEIFQTAALLAESFKFGPKSATTREESRTVQEASANIAEILGSQMVELLMVMDHHEDPFVVQTTLQAGMSALAEWYISSWCFGAPQNEELLKGIYQDFQESEEQAISGRWRALTRKHAQRIFPEPELWSHFADVLFQVLTVAGLDESELQLHEKVKEKVGERIGVVVKLVLRLNKAIGEGITSCDFEASYVPPETTFDSSVMEDSSGDDPGTGTGDPEKILCMTDLGLHRVEKMRKLESQEFSLQETIMLKPKVMLPSGLTR